MMSGEERCVVKADSGTEPIAWPRRTACRPTWGVPGGARPSGRAIDAQLVRDIRAGDPLAFGYLFDRWVDRLVDSIARLVCDQAIAAEVAQDVLLAAWQKLDELREPEAFGPWLLRSARNAAVTRIRKEARSSAVGNMDDVARVDQAPVLGNDDDDVADLCHRSQLADMIWDAAVALSPADRALLDLHVRQGLGTPELAEMLAVTTNNVHQKWFRVRRRLGVAIEALVVWHGGRPRCDALVAALQGAGVELFGKVAVEVIGRHADGCTRCDDRRRNGVDPSVLFDGGLPQRALGAQATA
jgi:RNA polymerase sigma-70 factor (ECF subfamily)